MFDRQLLGDLGLAVLLALPTAALARPEPVTPSQAAEAPLIEKAALADRTTIERRAILPG